MGVGSFEDDESLEAFAITHSDSGLSKVTLAQIRTFYLVARYQSVARAAKALGKNHVDITRQVRALDQHVADLTKSRIFKESRERGETLITSEGTEIAQLCANVLKAVYELEQAKRAAGSKVVKIGLTTFLLELVQELVGEFSRQRAKYTTQLIHLRTGNLESAVVRGDVDFAFGGRVSGIGQTFFGHPELDYQELRTDSFSFLTNFNLNGVEPKSIDDLVRNRIPVVLPTQGIIHDMIKEKLGCSSNKEIENVLNVVEWCDDVHFAFEIMRLKIHKCGMFILTGVFDHFQRFYSNRGKDEHISLWGLEDIGLMSSVVFLCRKDKVEHLDGNHHLRRCHDDILRWLRRSQ